VSLSKWVWHTVTWSSIATRLTAKYPSQFSYRICHVINSCTERHSRMRLAYLRGSNWFSKQISHSWWIGSLQAIWDAGYSVTHVLINCNSPQSVSHSKTIADIANALPTNPEHLKFCKHKSSLVHNLPWVMLKYFYLWLRLHALLAWQSKHESYTQLNKVCLQWFY